MVLLTIRLFHHQELFLNFQQHGSYSWYYISRCVCLCIELHTLAQSIRNKFSLPAPGKDVVIIQHIETSLSLSVFKEAAIFFTVSRIPENHRSFCGGDYTQVQTIAINKLYCLTSCEDWFLCVVMNEHWIVFLRNNKHSDID